MIEGPFSFLIKSKVKNCIVGGRDLFGQRPMYYINTDDYFAISSNANTLLEFNISKELNHNKILQFILNNYLKDGESFYKDVKKINGGNSFKYTKKEIFKREYLQPKSLITDPLKNKKVLFKNFRKTFFNTLNSILKNIDSKFASTLSGGLDSSSLFLAASKIHKRNIYSFSVHFDGISEEDFRKTDEKFYLNKVLSKTESIHTKIKLNYSDSGPINNQKKILPYSQPYGVINGYMHEAIYKECKDNNIEFLMDGLFGDEIISHGTYRLNELINKGNIFFFLYELLCLRKNKVIFSLKTQLKNYLINPLKRMIKLPFSFNKFREVSLNDHSFLLSSNFDNSKFLDSYKNTRTYYFKSDQDEQFKLFNSGIIEFALEQLYEISKQQNVETIYPFLDKRILKCALNVPVNLKLRNGVTRYYFKESIKDLIPVELYKRKTKSNISPFAKNQVQYNLDIILNDILEESSMVKKYISTQKFKSFYSKQLTHPETMIIFNLYNLNNWIKSNNK